MEEYPQRDVILSELGTCVLDNEENLHAYTCGMKHAFLTFLNFTLPLWDTLEWFYFDKIFFDDTKWIIVPAYIGSMKFIYLFSMTILITKRQCFTPLCC